MTDITVIYEGQFSTWYAEDESALAFGPWDYLVENIQNRMNEFGTNTLSVRYWVAEKPITDTMRNEAYFLIQAGLTEADFGIHYSDITGYLWTDQDLTIGGHDLANELMTYAELGWWLYMEVTYHDVKQAGK